MWWCTPLIPAIGVGVGGRRGRQISEFKASLVYKVSSRTARAIQRNPVSKTKQTKQNKTKQKSESVPLRHV
jgi:tartrate dehydratase alpha subunit/fumarate hydratase class I-like protein